MKNGIDKDITMDNNVDKVIQKVLDNLKEKYPGLKIVKDEGEWIIISDIELISFQVSCPSFIPLKQATTIAISKQDLNNTNKIIEVIEKRLQKYKKSIKVTIDFLNNKLKDLGCQNLKVCSHTTLEGSYIFNIDTPNNNMQFGNAISVCVSSLGSNIVEEDLIKQLKKFGCIDS